MGAYYLDTSALVKRYVQEIGSAWVVNLTLLAAGHEIFTALATGPEMIAALFRKVRTREVSQAEVAQAAARFRAEWQTQYHVVAFNSGVANGAMDLAERHGLRGYDAIHLATAVAVQNERQTAGLPSLTFVSADRSQLLAAMGEGCAVEDPNSYL